MLFYTYCVAIYGVFNGNLNVFYLFILFHSHNVGTLFVYIGYDLSSVSLHILQQIIILPCHVYQICSMRLLCSRYVVLFCRYCLVAARIMSKLG